MAVPTWVTNQVLTASDVNNWFVPVPAYKTGITTRTATSLSDDPDLTIPLEATAVYQVSAMIGYQNASGSALSIGRLRSRLVLLGGYGSTYAQPGPTLNPWFTTWTTVEDAAASDHAGHGMVLSGILITTSAGSMTLQWCCTTGSSGSLAVGVGSHLLARRVG